MKDDRDFEVFSGSNYRVLKTKDFGEIVFGCPPGIVKEFTRRKKDLPSKYVFPVRTFVKGRSNFDFEFIVYSFLFLKAQKSKVHIYCQPDQETRFKVVLGETLFGPTFLHLLEAQFHKIPKIGKFTPEEVKRFNALLKKISADKKLHGMFDQLLKSHVGQRTLTQRIQKYFIDLLAQHEWLRQKNIPRLTSRMSQHYILCAQLRREVDIFGLTSEDTRDEFIHETIQFHHMDETGTVYIESGRDKRKKLKMTQMQNSIFRLYQGTDLKCTIDIRMPEHVRKTYNIDPIEKPYMGVTFLGVGSGFSATHENSCLIVWSEGKGIMVDVLSESYILAMKYGITEKDLNYMFLTHVHSDHDGGILEKILHAQRVNVISTRIIFESFLRKVEAITCLPKSLIEGFCDFIEVEPHKPIKLPGFKNSYFTFDYSFHSIPAGRFRLTYKDNGVDKVISHSGDTKYDRDKIQKWYEEGKFTKARRDSILGFIWDADLIIHDVGGGVLHTDLDALRHLEDQLGHKMILVHQDKDPTAGSKFRFAPEGETEILIKNKSSRYRAELETIKQVKLFSKLQENHLLEIFAKSEVEKYKDGEVVFAQNEMGDSFYVILNGFAEIVIDGKVFSVYEKGNFFGELAITTKNPLRRATVRAKGPLTLLKINKQYYQKFKLPAIQDNLYNLRDYFTDILNPELLASLAFGKMVQWKKGEALIKYGAVDTDMYILLSGEVEVQNKAGGAIASLGTGDTVGEIACVKKVSRTATVIAKSDEVFGIRLQSEEVKKVLKLYPSFFGTVYQNIKKREAEPVS